MNSLGYKSDLNKSGKKIKKKTEKEGRETERDRETTLELNWIVHVQTELLKSSLWRGAGK